MSTPYFSYLGNHCGLIRGFGFNKAPYVMTAETWMARQAALKTDIDAHPELGLLAITADFYQVHAHELLKANGFRKAFVFKSNHNRDDENLTVWVKENRQAKNVKYQAPDYPPNNCSVTFNADENTPARLLVQTTKPVSRLFKKIRGVNAWYKIDPRYVVKTPA